MPERYCGYPECPVSQGAKFHDHKPKEHLMKNRKKRNKGRSGGGHAAPIEDGA